ncbi:hypothetical protein LY78DRAFT_197021 [Colletotrichum sublineola]|nr:hypothetical protein LY78DRAFT_197021 [Colletotrichum sublineola]
MPLPHGHVHTSKGGRERLFHFRLIPHFKPARRRYLTSFIVIDSFPVAAPQSDHTIHTHPNPNSQQMAACPCIMNPPFFTHTCRHPPCHPPFFLPVNPCSPSRSSSCPRQAISGCRLRRGPTCRGRDTFEYEQTSVSSSTRSKDTDATSCLWSPDILSPPPPPPPPPPLPLPPPSPSQRTSRLQAGGVPPSRGGPMMHPVNLLSLPLSHSSCPGTDG